MPTLDLNTYTFSGTGTYAPGGGHCSDMPPALNLTANSAVSIIAPPPLPVAPPPYSASPPMTAPNTKKNLIYLQRKWGYWAVPNVRCTGDSAEDTTHFIPDFVTIIGAVRIDFARCGGTLIGVMVPVMHTISVGVAVVMPASQAAEGTSKMPR
ncbi:hypothetical protein FB451DRAFT_1181420 [Mycena latifolia]|nr:hypothetical protein FB451DRAFT_1181420 [Mycena latifolia]